MTRSLGNYLTLWTILLFFQGLDAAEAPKPWATTVRIRVNGSRQEFRNNPDGTISAFREQNLGSGTIIRSTPGEAIILTAAHVFQPWKGQPATAARFPIFVDLFNGEAISVPNPPKEPVRLAFNGESYSAEAIEFDYAHDVALIRIRPKRVLPASPLMPREWAPKIGEELTEVGSPGEFAIAQGTWVRNPNYQNDDNPS